MTHRIEYDERLLQEQARHVIEVLSTGAVVALPTETVPGLFIAHDNAGAMEKIYALKSRHLDRKLAFYVADPFQAELRSASFSPGARRLGATFWPGPLTIVIEEQGGATIGFRCSSHPLVRAVAQAATFPIAGTSANLSGQPPLPDMDAVEAEFGDKVGLLMHATVSTKGVASTVVLIPWVEPGTLQPSRFEVLREGAITPSEIHRALRPHILFVCTGNTCRSPMAVAIAQQVFSARGIDVVCDSGGLAAYPGDPASQGAVRVVADEGLDLSGHRASLITAERIERSDLVLTMTESQQWGIVSLLPDHAARIRRLDPHADVLDPFGGDDRVYRDCARHMRRAMERLAQEMQ